MHYFIVWKLPYISVCGSRGLIVIDSGMIVFILLLNNEELPRVTQGYPCMLGYFIQTSEYHMIFTQTTYDYASIGLYTQKQVLHKHTVA